VKALTFALRKALRVLCLSAILAGYMTSMTVANEATRTMLAAARMVVAVMSDPKVPFTVSALVKATGLTSEIVRQVLTDDRFRELIEMETRRTLGGYMLRATHVIDGIVQTSKSEAMRIAGFRALVTAYDVMSGATAKHRSADAEDEVAGLLGELRKFNQKKIEIKETKNASSRRVPTTQAPPTEDQE
jgi:hypothetical protein